MTLRWASLRGASPRAALYACTGVIILVMIVANIVIEARSGDASDAMGRVGVIAGDDEVVSRLLVERAARAA